MIGVLTTSFGAGCSANGDDAESSAQERLEAFAEDLEAGLGQLDIGTAETAVREQVTVLASTAAEDHDAEILAIEIDVTRGHVSGSIDVEASEQYGSIIHRTATATETYDLEATPQRATVRVR